MQASTAAMFSWDQGTLLCSSLPGSQSYNLSTPSCTMIPEPSWKDSDIDIAFMATKSTIFFSAPVVSYCISQHPFPNETSQMNCESFTDL